MQRRACAMFTLSTGALPANHPFTQYWRIQAVFFCKLIDGTTTPCCLDTVYSFTLGNATLVRAAAAAFVPLVVVGAGVGLEPLELVDLGRGELGVEEAWGEVLIHVRHVHRAGVRHHVVRCPLPCDEDLGWGEAVRLANRRKDGLFDQHTRGRNVCRILVEIGNAERAIRIKHNIVLVAKVEQFFLWRVQVRVERAPAMVDVRR